MIEKILTRSIRAICVGAMALGMTTAMAQDTSLVLQHAGAVDGERLVVVAYSDPEGEVGNGTFPPRREANSEAEIEDGLHVPMEIDNFPESEVGNGTEPPNVIPQYVKAGIGSHITVVAYSDPESEVNNGTKPRRIANDPENEVDEDTDVPMEVDNFPETEVGNGTNPPYVNP